MLNTDDVPDIESAVKLFRFGVKNNIQTEYFNQINKFLYNVLISPIYADIKQKELIIIPDKLFFQLPFELLVLDNGKYLVEEKNITYAPSLKIFKYLNNIKKEKNENFILAFGGVDYNYPDNDYLVNTFNLNREAAVYLPATLEEVEHIAEISPRSKLLIGEDASEKQLKKMSKSGELLKYDIIHFATHANINKVNPELSNILLSYDKGEDGILTIDEILNLKINSDLINLSACSTGEGKIYSGEGVIGFMHAFILAGNNNFILSLWPIADHSTSIFMKRFYDLTITNSLSYSDAINQTKNEFIRGEHGDKYRAPFYWAPFVYFENKFWKRWNLIFSTLSLKSV